MSNLFSAFATVAIVLSFVANTAADTYRAATARDGVLSLRNGQVIRGKISLLGDRFVVTLPKGGQIRVPVHDVELEGKNLGEIYDFKRAKLLHPRPEDHLRLAHWCLNQHLVLRAMQEVEEAKRKGGSPHLAAVE